MPTFAICAETARTTQMIFHVKAMSKEDAVVKLTNVTDGLNPVWDKGEHQGPVTCVSSVVYEPDVIVETVTVERV
jgi:hypothetical protein